MPEKPSRTLSAFMQVSLDGYYCDPRGDMSFARKPPEDAEWHEFVSGNARAGGMLLFGRTTYDMMAGWWPTRPAGKSLFAGLTRRLDLVLTSTRVFNNGSVVLWHAPR